MAVVPLGTIPSWLDVASRMDPKGQIDTIVEIMNDYNPMIADAAVYEGNLTTGHKSTQRTGLPSVAWRLLNQGVPQSKSTTQQVTDTCGMLEGYSEIDKKMAKLNSNSAAFMASEDLSFLEAMSQRMETSTIEGNTALNPERFMGLQPRYSTLATTDRRQASYNCIAADATPSGSDQSSIYLVTWGVNTAFHMFPKGSKAGFEREYLGQKTLTDADGNQYEGYRTHYAWDIGMVVNDWRSCGRICNIDTSAISASGTNIAEAMIRLLHRIRGASGRRVWYCGETVYTYLDLQAQNKDNVYLSHGEFAGKEVVTFRGIPIRQTDAITDGEAIVS